MASVVRNPYVMQGHLARYDSALNYEAIFRGVSLMQCMGSD